MRKKQRQHYVSRFYLEGFTKNGQFWVYDRKLHEFRKQTPDNTCIEKDINEFEFNDSRTDGKMEALCSKIEGWAAPIIKNLDDKKRLTDEECSKLAIFIAFALIRVPASRSQMDETFVKMYKDSSRKLLKDIETTEHLIKDFEARKDIHSGLAAKEFYDYVHSDEFNVSFDSDHNLLHRFDFGLDLCNHLYKLDWIFYSTSPNYCFIASDNPFTLIDLKVERKLPVGILTPHVIKVFPLSPQSCIVLGDKGSSTTYRPLPRRFIKGFNEEVAINSERFVIARDELQLRKIIKSTRLDKLPLGSRGQLKKTRVIVL